MTNLFAKLLKNRRGAALLEYALLIAGVALIAAASVSIFGHKTTDLISAVAAIIPGAHADDNGPLVSGKLIETTEASSGQIQLDAAAITAATDSERLGNNVLGATTNTATPLNTLIVEAN